MEEPKRHEIETRCKQVQNQWTWREEQLRRCNTVQIKTIKVAGYWRVGRTLRQPILQINN